MVVRAPTPQPRVVCAVDQRFFGDHDRDTGKAVLVEEEDLARAA
jgi:hypothetical protein